MKKRKAITLLFSIGIIASLVCVTVGSDKRAFKPRYSAPSFGDSCYYSDNVFYNSGYGMPNCTAYAWGRAYEILGSEPELSTSNAGDWYEYNLSTSAYPCGKTPRVGSIACFSNESGGHVAVVESIEDGVITFSNSAYGGENFYLTHAGVEDENPGQDGWIFQGYIYLTGDSDSLRYVDAESGLNLRTEPSISSDIITAIPYDTPVYITSFESGDGYLWARTSYGGAWGYCAMDYLRKEPARF